MHRHAYACICACLCMHMHAYVHAYACLNFKLNIARLLAFYYIKVGLEFCLTLFFNSELQCGCDEGTRADAKRSGIGTTELKKKFWGPDDDDDKKWHLSLSRFPKFFYIFVQNFVEANLKKFYFNDFFICYVLCFYTQN